MMKEQLAARARNIAHRFIGCSGRTKDYHSSACDDLTQSILTAFTDTIEDVATFVEMNIDDDAEYLPPLIRGLPDR